jgi:hypothetical protein
MAIPVAFRDAVIACVVAAATAAAFVTATPLPWTINLPASLLSGAVFLLVDVLVWGRPAPRATPAGRWTLAVAGVIAELSALSLAFFVGRHSHPESVEYPFRVVVPDGLPTVEVKAAPLESAGKRRYLAPNDAVSVECYVTQPDGRWYKLSGDEGWLSGDEVLPAPYTGLGSPPQCPA